MALMNIPRPPGAPEPDSPKTLPKKSPGKRSQKASKGISVRAGIGGVSVAPDRQNEEQILLGVMVAPKRMLRTVQTLPESEFLVPEHQAIWKLFREQVNRAMLGDFADLTRSARGLRSDGAKEARKLVAALRESSRGVSWEDIRVENRLKILGTDAVKRRALDGPLSDLMRAISSPTADLSTLSTYARRLEQSLRGGSYGQSIIAPSVAVRDYMESIHRGIAEETRIYGIGEPGFDQLLGAGFAPGDTSVMIGGTGEGKSTVALNFARLWADMGRTVAYCAWEEGSQRCLDKIVSAKLGIPFTDVVRRDLRPEQAVAIEEVCHHYLTGGPGGKPLIKFVENPFLRIWMERGRTKWGVTNQDNMEAVEGIIVDSGADIIIYDMWERLRAEGSIHSTEKAYEFTQSLHSNYGIHGMILGQTNMDKVDNHGADKSRTSSMKGSKKGPETADLFISLDRPALTTGRPDPSGRDVIRLCCGKQRVQGIVPTPWEAEFTWEGGIQKISEPRLVRRVEPGQIDEPQLEGNRPPPADGIDDGEFF